MLSAVRRESHFAMNKITNSKVKLRDILRRRRQALTAQQQSLAALAVVQSVCQLPQWASANHIALYLPADGELDTTALAELARAQNKTIYLPVIGRDKTLSFARWQPDRALIKNSYGIPEPAPQSLRCAVGALDIIFLPLVGWDRQGGRLGMGGGFYDRTLCDIPGPGPLRVGLGHHCQEADQLPREPWDVLMHFVATDTELCRCSNSLLESIAE